MRTSNSFAASTDRRNALGVVRATARTGRLEPPSATRCVSMVGRALMACISDNCLVTSLSSGGAGPRPQHSSSYVYHLTHETGPHTHPSAHCQRPQLSRRAQPRLLSDDGHTHQNPDQPAWLPLSTGHVPNSTSTSRAHAFTCQRQQRPTPPLTPPPEGERGSPSPSLLLMFSQRTW